MSVPNRAEHPNRKMADHDTALIHLHGNMRPSGTSISIQERNPSTGGYGAVKPAGTYETGSVETVHALLTHQKSAHPIGTKIHAETTYHPDDIASERARVADSVSKESAFSESSMPSGLGRQLAINSEATNRVPTKAATSYTAG